MSSKKKTIAINPELFSLTGKKGKDKKNKTQKNKKGNKFNFVNPNQLRKNLLAKIKEHKEKNVDSQIGGEKIEKESTKEDKNLENFNSNFKESMNYLSGLVEKDKIKNKTPRKKLGRKRTLKNKIGSNNFDPDSIEVNLKLPTEFSELDNNFFETKASNEPAYGCLKGGNKPTFREWKSKTQKNFGFNIDRNDDDDDEKDFEEEIQTISKNLENNIETPIESDIEENDNNQVFEKIDIKKSDFSERKKKLDELKASSNFLTKKTIKRKYKLGKSKDNKRISVLIKGNSTKKKIMDEKKNIQKKEMKNIKKYLKEHNLVRVGSNTPNDVLKTMYESAILSGYVKNQSGDVLLHNYLNE